jgi:hypothetical protein
MQGINTLTHGFTATIASKVVGHFSNRELALYSLAASPLRVKGSAIRINGEPVRAEDLADALEDYGKPEIQEIREAAHA